MDIDDDDEYMNAAAAYAAFVMTVSSAIMYWYYVMHSARDINIHNLHPLPEKNRLGPLCRFSAQWNTPFIPLKAARLPACTQR